LNDLIPSRSIVASYGPAPLRATFIRHSSNVLLLSKADRDRWTKLALLQTANYWIENYLPLRFDRGYASFVMGYKIGGRRPFHATGALMALVRSGTKAKESMRANGASVAITIPMTAESYKNPQVRAGLKIVPPTEIIQLAKVFDAELQLGMKHMTTRTLGKRSASPGSLVQRFKKSSIADVLSDKINRAKLYKLQGLRGIGKKKF